jgi:hypothetical protein
MNRSQKWVVAVLLLLVVATAGAILYTRDWATSARRLHADQMRSAHTTQQLVDTSALQTAQQLAPLAVTSWEREYAQEALRLADHSVDLAFTAALDDAKENPAPLTTETRPLVARVKDADALLNVDQDRVAQLTGALAKARPSTKDDVQHQLDLAKAQMSLDQDELDDAHEDLTRAGGDKLSLVQDQLDQHEASEAHTGKSSAPAASSSTAPAHLLNPRRRRTCWRKSKRFSRCVRRKVSCRKRGKMLWIASPNIRPSMKLSKSNWTMKKYRKRS